ncbi:alpha/beta hydrolase fold [Pantoea agglomerans]|uniref:Alpha/beta hydrolase fold n=1 Tax=Enterobacter agglomerans TaxID=549 RepID=A0A379ANL2_ENTAG|nr:alpha/beta hydrolase fold [Pantoea agglomerans]
MRQAPAIRAHSRRLSTWQKSMSLTIGPLPACVAREMAIWHPVESNGITLLVAPGGGYQRVMIDREGSALATFFTSMGYTLAVMTYRLPYDGHHEGPDAPLADAQRAVRVLRERAQRGLNGKYIVMMGFSAGGHVAASLGTRFAEKLYPVQDGAENFSPRPDAMVLVYPVISMRDGIAHEGARTRLLGCLARSENH